MKVPLWWKTHLKLSKTHFCWSQPLLASLSEWKCIFGVKQMRCWPHWCLPACNLAALTWTLSHHSSFKTTSSKSFCRRARSLLPPQRNAAAPVKPHNDQLTVMMAWIDRGTTLSSLGGLAGGLKSTPAISPPFERTLSLKVLHACAAKMGQERALMVLFGGFLQNAWDGSATQLIVLHKFLHRSSAEEIICSISGLPGFNGVSINMFVQNELTVAVMSRNYLFVCCLTCLGLPVSQHKLWWDHIFLIISQTTDFSPDFAFHVYKMLKLKPNTVTWQ